MADEKKPKGAEVISLSALLKQDIGAPTPAVGEDGKFTFPKKEDDFMGLNPTKSPEELEAERVAEAAEVARVDAEAETKTPEELAAEAEALLALGGTKTPEEIQAESDAEAARIAAEAGTKTPEEIEAARVEAERIAAEGGAEETAESVALKASITNLFGDDVQAIIEVDEAGVEKEILLADVEMTQELYETIVKNRLEAIEETAKKGTVSTEGISELTRELIEIDREGGNITAILKSQETYIDVLDRMDLTNVEHQKQAVLLRYQAEGTKSPKEMEILVKGFEAAGELESMAVTADKEIRDAVAKQVDDAKLEAVEANKTRATDLKAYQKELRTQLDRFDLSDHIKTKLAKAATKESENGRYEVDELFYKMKNDPETAADLMLFLLDNEEYKKQIGSKVKKAVQLSTAGKIKLVKKSAVESNLKAGGKGDKGKIVSLSALREK